MNRRAFVRLLASGMLGSLVGHELDVDRLLWVPGARKIFLPSENQFLTTQWMTNEALRMLHNNLVLAQMFRWADRERLRQLHLVKSAGAEELQTR